MASPCPWRLLRVADGYHQVEVSAPQYELIGQRVGEVLVHEHLWDQGVRFGANFDREKSFYFVFITRATQGSAPARSSTGCSGSFEPGSGGNHGCLSAGGVGL